VKQSVKKTFILPILLLANSVWAAENTLTEEQSHMVAADKVLTLQMIMKRMSETCLAETGEFISTWNSRNSTTVKNANMLVEQFYQRIKEKRGTDKANQFKMEMNDHYEKTASGIAQGVKSSPKDKKLGTCQRFHTDINAGAWDIKNKYPNYYKMLSKY